MNRTTLIRSHRHELLSLVRPRDRYRAGILLATIEDQWAQISAGAEQQAYQRGVTDATPEKSVEDVAWGRGWKAGCQEAMNQIIARAGVPARRQNDDELLPPC